jgi:hypothetical protein
MSLANPLAYFDTGTITSVKSFILQASNWHYYSELSVNCHGKKFYNIDTRSAMKNLFESTAPKVTFGGAAAFGAPQTPAPKPAKPKVPESSGDNLVQFVFFVTPIKIACLSWYLSNWTTLWCNLVEVLKHPNLFTAPSHESLNIASLDWPFSQTRL